MIIYVTICSIYDSRFMVTYCLNNQWHYFVRFEPFLTFSLLHFQYVTKNVIIEHQNINFLILDRRRKGSIRYVVSSKTHFKIKLCWHPIYLPHLCLSGQNEGSNYEVKSNMAHMQDIFFLDSRLVSCRFRVKCAFKSFYIP